jgi:hypothetical protein
MAKKAKGAKGGHGQRTAMEKMATKYKGKC